MKNLVIVESPTKAKTISKFLGKDYEIRPSMGHVMDLPKSRLGVNVDKDFEAGFEVVKDKQPLLSEIKKLAKDAEVILLATDPDREGEAIAANIKEIINSNAKNKDKYKRIVFHEITEHAIIEAIDNPREVDENLVGAQTARRVLDRLVGYLLSPILWKKVRRGLSAGRVQSVALRLIVEREREIEKFGKEPYWSIHAKFKQDNEKAVEFTLSEISGVKVDKQQKLNLYAGDYTYSKTTIDSAEKANELLNDIKENAYSVSEVNTKETKRSPYPPFTTSTLQQQASVRYGYSGKRTMSLAQKLYEEGYITYHRTDSVNLAPVAIKQIREYINQEFGEKYLPKEPRLYFTKQKNAQEAHEAIRPTKFNNTPLNLERDLGKDYARIYELIWQRTVASQMNDALIESTTVFADSKNNPVENEIKYRFKASGSVLIFDGFLKLTPLALEDNRLPKFESGKDLELNGLRSEKHDTTPPPRYNDASLIKILEEKGIGRPSTYASIVSTLTDRTYVDREEKKFIPTTIGNAVNDFLVTNFSNIDDVPFTALMETDLDLVANGEKEWHHMMKEFYAPFAKKLKEVEGADRVQIAVEETGELCPECKEGKQIIRTGKFGKFYSCSRFPNCRFTKQFVEEVDVPCPKDDGKVLVKKTKKGRKFFGCANYPNCDFASWKLEDIKK